MFKDFDVWKFPIIHVTTSMFNNTRLGHCRLLHKCYLDILGLSFSTHSLILFFSEYFPYKIFTSRGPVTGRGPAVEKHWPRVLSVAAWCWVSLLNSCQPIKQVRLGVQQIENVCPLIYRDPGSRVASCTMGTGSFPGVNRPGRGADHPSPPSVEVDNE
jgi:hypothetical protein